MAARDYQIDAHKTITNSVIGKIILPTGTGKSYIQGMVLKSHCEAEPSTLVILTPRIALTNQLATTVGRQLLDEGIKFEVVTVHSGQKADFSFETDDCGDQELRQKIADLGGEVIVTVDELADKMLVAKSKKVSLLVCCTYHSCPKLVAALKKAKLKVKQVMCDEAHYIIENKFFGNIADLKPYAKRIHFFTATEKINKDGDIDDGNGMQNESFYGPVLFRKTPREMIQAGWIVQPRIHVEYADSDMSEGALVAAAFVRHQQEVSYNAKLLVCCNGNSTIEKVISNKRFNDVVAANDITVFRISSEGGAWIDSVDYSKKRTEFFKLLRGCGGKAIVLHINILTEGIDVPDFSGVMFLRNMELARFLQSIGRAMRKHTFDGLKVVSEFDSWIKPYAWAIFVERSGDYEDADRNANLRSNIQKMRDAGYLDGVDLREEVVLGYDKGITKPEEPTTTNATKEDGLVLRNKFSDLFEVIHDMESEDKARLVAVAADDYFDQIIDKFNSFA